MARRISAGLAAEVPNGGGICVKDGRDAIAVFNIGGVFYACDNVCPHAGGPLSDGFIRGTSVVCPWHGWDFDLSVSGDEAGDGCTRYRVVEEDGNLYVELDYTLTESKL